MIIEDITNCSHIIQLLNDDHWTSICTFLTPSDFYNLRSSCGEYSQLDHYIYWINHPRKLSFSKCLKACCPSLFSYMLSTQNINQNLLVQNIVPKCTTYNMHNILYNYVMQLKQPGLTSQVICKYIELKNYTYFNKYVLTNYSNVNIWWEEIFDLAYANQNWIMLAILFTYKTRYFITWVFGNFQTIIDSEIIVNLNYIYMNLPPNKKTYLVNIIKKYYEWLWYYKSNYLTSLDAIIKIDELNLFNSNLQEKIDVAMRSPHKEFLEYIIIKERPKLDLQQTKNISYDKAKLIYKQHLLEKYNNIIIMLIALIVCAVYSTFLTESSSSLSISKSSTGARLNKIEV